MDRPIILHKFCACAWGKNRDLDLTGVVKQVNFNFIDNAQTPL